MNKKMIRNAGALALTAVLALAPVALAQQQAVLSGTTNGLAWTLYGPGELGSLSNQSTTLRVSAHPQATVRQPVGGPGLPGRCAPDDGLYLPR